MRMDAATKTRYEGECLKRNWPFANTFAGILNFFNTMHQLITVAASTIVILRDLPVTIVARQTFMSNRILVCNHKC